MMWRRGVRPLTVFLLLVVGGAVVNVAVALALARWGSKPAISFDNLGVEVTASDADIALWKAHAPAGWDLVPSHGFLHAFPGKRYVQMVRVENSFDTSGLSEDEFQAKMTARKAFVLWIADLGWPQLCIGAEGWYEVTGFQVSSVQYSAWLSRKGVPSRMIWPGFAINTIFYAAVLWMLFFGVTGGVRRAIRGVRRRRGRCPACAYPIGTSAVCTECGRKVAGLRSECGAAVAKPRGGGGM